MTQENEIQENEENSMSDEAYSDEFCRGEGIPAIGRDPSNFVHNQVRSDFTIHCHAHNISMEQLATMANVSLERLQAFYDREQTLSLQEWIRITDALGFKDYFTVGRKEKNRLIKKNSSLKILTELIKKAQFDISLSQYAWMLDSLSFGKFAIILFPPMSQESIAYCNNRREEFRKELREKRKNGMPLGLREYYEID